VYALILQSRVLVDALRVHYWSCFAATTILKGTLKYYVNWETRGSRSAKLACKFEVLAPGKLGLAHSA
jgi:hypothetical protein